MLKYKKKNYQSPICQLKEAKLALICYTMSLKRAREDKHEIPLQILVLKKKCISHKKILKCVSGTYRLTNKSYIWGFFGFFFGFFLIDNS